MSTQVNFKIINKTLTANLKTALSDTPIRVQQFEIHIPSGSTGPVYIGNADVTTSWIPRVAGSTAAFTSSSGGDFVSGPWFDLSKIYILSATGGDTARIMYIEREAA